MVSLGAPFGSGKSTFLRMWHADLNARYKSDESTPQPIVLNAWESDFAGDPLIAIVTGLIDAATNSNNGESSESSANLREAAKDAAWFATGLANSFVSRLTGVDPIKAGEFAANKKAEARQEEPDLIRLYKEKHDSLERLRTSLKAQFGDSKGGAVIMIDELDRCRPDYAINYLETIKHVFDVPGLTFVLAVDQKRLASAAAAIFGELNFEEYYRKFVHRIVNMPVPESENLTKLARAYASAFLEKEGTRMSLLRVEDHTITQVVELIGAFHLTPRQTQEAFRIMGHVMAGNEKSRGRIFWCLGVGVILISALKVGQSKVYDRLLAGTMSHLDVGKFLIEHLGREKADWWFSVYVSGAGEIIGSGSEDLESLYRSLGFVATDAAFDVRQRLAQFVQGWGHSYTNRIGEILTKIEHVSSF